MITATSDQLEQRLDIGWQMCEAEPDHNRRMVLEDHWLQLLHEYESVVDRERRCQDNNREAA